MRPDYAELPPRLRELWEQTDRRRRELRETGTGALETYRLLGDLTRHPQSPAWSSARALALQMWVEESYQLTPDPQLIELALEFLPREGVLPDNRAALCFSLAQRYHFSRASLGSHLATMEDACRLVERSGDSKASARVKTLRAELALVTGDEKLCDAIAALDSDATLSLSSGAWVEPYREAERWFAAADAAFAFVGEDLKDRIKTLGNRAFMLLLLGDLSEARVKTQRARLLALRHRLLTEQADLEIFRAIANVFEGGTLRGAAAKLAFEQAHAWVTEVAQWVRDRTPRDEMWALLLATWLERRLGEVDFRKERRLEQLRSDPSLAHAVRDMDRQGTLCVCEAVLTRRFRLLLEHPGSGDSDAGRQAPPDPPTPATART